MRRLIHGIVLLLLPVAACATAPNSTPGSNLRFDGVYRHTGTLPDGTDYCKYLRFYPDGVVITVSSTGKPEDLRRWFSREHPGVPIGKLTTRGKCLSFTATSKEGSVDYTGEMEGDQLHLRLYSHINQRRSSGVFHFVSWQVDQDAPAGDDGPLSQEDTAARREAQEERIRELIENIAKRTGFGPYRYPNIEELARIGRRAVPFLIEALEDRTRPHNHAAQALGGIGADAADAVPALIRILDYEPHRSDVIRCLGEIGPAAGAAAPALIRVLRESQGEEGHLGTITVRALGKIGDRSAVPVLIEVLDAEGDDLLKASAAHALADFGDRSATPSLILAYGSPHRGIREAAIIALRRLRDPRALDTLADALDEESEMIRLYAASGIAALAESVEEAALLRAMTSALDGKPHPVRRWVVDALEDTTLWSGAKSQLLGSEASEEREPKYRFELESMGPFRHATVEVVGENNAYVCGSDVRRLDDTGAEQWSLDIPAVDGVEVATIDEAGNVYLAGVQRNSRAFVAAKVDGSGRLVWVAEAPAAASKYGEPKAIAIQQDGQVLLAGSYDPDGATDTRIVVVGFTKVGRLARVTLGDRKDSDGRYAVAGRDLAPSQLMAVDGDGRVHAMFRKFFARSEPQMVLSCFDGEGGLKWVAPCEEFDHLGPAVMKVDAEGNTYLAGENTIGKGRLLKVNANGRVEWARDLDGDGIKGMDLTSKGEIVAGWNRRPSRRCARIAVLGGDGVVKRIEDVLYETGPGDRGFLVELAAGVSGSVSIVIQWQETIVRDGRAYTGSPGSRLATFELQANEGDHPSGPK